MMRTRTALIIIVLTALAAGCGMSYIRGTRVADTKANVLITYNRWLTGRVVLPEAISIMTIQ